MHTPGIHTNAKLIYADYAMVYKKNTHKKHSTQTEQKTKKCKVKNIYAKLQASNFSVTELLTKDQQCVTY